jgi:cytochrome b6-f complex iron-sulfur subunit
MEPSDSPQVTGMPQPPADATPVDATPADAPPDSSGATGGVPSAGQDEPPGATVHSRRNVLRWLGGFAIVSTVAMVITPVIGFLIPSKSAGSSAGGKVLVGTTSDIPAGSGKVVAFGSKPAVVTNTAQGVKAFSAICTHLGCVVAYNDMVTAIECPCHGGRFDPTTGAVTSGPPPSPLPPLTVSVEGEQIFLSET